MGTSTTFAVAANNFSIAGNWSNDGSYTTSVGQTVTFNKSGTQSIGGASTTTFRTLAMATGSQLSLAASANYPVTLFTVNSVTKGAATWGSTSSAATAKDNTLFAATTGILTDETGVGLAAMLAFGVQPSTTTAGSAISPSVTVRVTDAAGNTVTTDSSTVTISSGTTAFSASTLSAVASSGVATFSNLKPTTAGTANTLLEVDGVLTGATSSAFTVNSTSCNSIDLVASWTTVGSTSIKITLQDDYGLSKVRGLRYVNLSSVTYTAYNAGGSVLATGAIGDWVANNANEVTLPGGTVGTVKVEVLGVRANSSLKASINAQAFDLCNSFSKTIDPVNTHIEVGEAGVTTQTFTEIPSAEHYVIVQNGSPGLMKLTVQVNGKDFVLASLVEGEIRKLDIASAMNPGEENTVVLIGVGAPGSSADVSIGDSPNGDLVEAVVGTTIILRADRSDQGLLLSWPEAAAGLELQSQLELDAGGAWTRWPEAPTVQNGRYGVAVPVDSGPKLFRLHKP